MTTELAVDSRKAGIPTPLKVFLLVLAGLALLISSPFTVGPLLSCAGRVLEVLYKERQAWAAAHVLASWLLMASMGFSYLTAVLLLGAGKTSVWERSRAQVAMLVTLAVLIAVVAVASFCALPPMAELYDTFIAAGAQPTWLAWLAATVVVICANGVNTVLVVAVVAFFGSSGD